MRAFAFATALALFGAAAPSFAQDTDYENQIRQQLGFATVLFAEEGLTLKSVQHSSMGASATESMYFDLQGNIAYKIVGVCDTDCSDLDITLFDENGNEIASDLLEDDAPIVEVTPLRSARFRADVTMFACSVEPCFYGLGLYAK